MGPKIATSLIFMIEALMGEAKKSAVSVQSTVCDFFGFMFFWELRVNPDR